MHVYPGDIAICLDTLNINHVSGGTRNPGVIRLISTLGRLLMDNSDQPGSVPDHPVLVPDHPGLVPDHPSFEGDQVPDQPGQVPDHPSFEGGQVPDHPGQVPGTP